MSPEPVQQAASVLLNFSLPGVGRGNGEGHFHGQFSFSHSHIQPSSLDVIAHLDLRVDMRLYFYLKAERLKRI